MKIRQKIQELIKEYNITEVVLEDIQLEKGVGNNVITFKALAEVIGVITFKIIPSSTWRSGLDIKGNQRKVYKKNAQIFVEKNYSKTATEDESDAICIGTHYIRNEKMSSAF